MRVINKPSGAGKTTELVRIMLEPGNEDVVYVAPTRAQAERAGYLTAVSTFRQDETPELKARFISANEMRSRVGRNERYVFDEFDVVLRTLLGDVIAVAGTERGI